VYTDHTNLYEPQDPAHKAGFFIAKLIKYGYNSSKELNYAIRK